MAINLTNLFTALGHLYYPLKRAHTFVATNLATDVAAAVAGLGVTNADLSGPLASGLGGLQSTTQLGQLIRTVAQQYLCRVVAADVPLADRNSVPLAVAELIRQMIAQSYKVSACTVTASAAAVSGNVGTGVVVCTTLNPYGLTQDNMFAEVGLLTCTGDAQNGTSTAGSEPFQYRGDYPPASDLGYDWPGYSGATAGLTTIDAGASASLVTNGTFETFTVTDTPDSWDLATGTVATTNIFAEGTLFYRGAKAVKFLGNGTTRPTIRQTLTLKPNRVYAVNLFARASGVLTSTSSLKVRLVDGSNSVIVDDQGNANGITVALTALTTGYVAYSGILITPKTLPSSGVKLQLESSNGADMVAAEAVYVDALAMAEATYLYPGGPGIGIFAGAVPFMTNDAFNVTTTNNQNGASYGATFQRVADRLWGMRGLQLLLPTTGTTLLNDSLIA